MRVALLYPPPWKIAAPDEPGYGADGPPEGYREGDLDADFYQTPYGLFTLGAEARAAGHQLKVYNLSAFSWSRVREVIQRLKADVYGMSCWTANRRGVGLVAQLIREIHPDAHVVVGGPHATPLAREMLEHHPAIDTVCEGESELTFLELLERLGRGESNRDLAGAWYRVDGQVEKGPPRAAIADLDTLESPHRHFDTHIVMTSRGCPWQCTFCGAETSWGRGFRARSVPRVLDDLEAALGRLSVKMIQIKDDTFTTNKKRVMKLCQGIRERELGFLWSCDTRVDVLTEELLREMRLAGCQRLSLGVESGSQRILDAINKKITVDEIVNAAQMAKRVGIRVRFYMMLGNRGETQQSFRETLAFLERAQPHEYIFSCLSIYPGTIDFRDAEAEQRVDREEYFRGSFQELKTPFDADEATTELMTSWFYDHVGLQQMYRPTLADCQAVLEHLGDHHAAHMDLGGAHYREGNLDQAQHHVERALELGWPVPGLAYNTLACIAHARGDLQAMMDLFMTAAKTDPQHHVLIRNVQAAREWFAANGPGRGVPLGLEVNHDFQLLERTLQPTLPGPLPENFADWEAAPADVGPGALASSRVGSQASFKPRTRLKLM